MSEDSTQEPPRSGHSWPVFRQEAIEHHAGLDEGVHLLQLTPAWARLAYWLLVAICSVGLLYAILGRVNEYARGVAVIESRGRIDITIHAGGTVESIDVRPGQRVAASEVLGRLHSAHETAELGRVERELELQLVKILRDPGDSAARAAMASLRAEHELAASRVDERTLRAPHAGVVADVRIRPGQQVAPGDIALSLLGEHAGFRVIAVLPGQYRPLVRPGMPLRLELAGFPHVHQSVTIERVSNEVIGPAEARRYFRQPIADALQFPGPVIIVEATLPGRSFTVRGQELGFHEGMMAGAEVAVRSESILVTLIPGLTALLESDGDQL